jgi:hypothetical protein
MVESTDDIFELGLTNQINEVQKALPDWLTLTVSSISYFDEMEHFHIKLNDIFIPLDYYQPAKKINDLIDTLQNYVRYTGGDFQFYPIQAFTSKDYFELNAAILHEIVTNLGEAPLAIFISKHEWYVDLYQNGFFYPLPHVSASEFLDYISDTHDF